MVCFVYTYPLDSDLSGGQRYPAFEQPGPVLLLFYLSRLIYQNSLSSIVSCFSISLNFFMYWIFLKDIFNLLIDGILLFIQKEMLIITYLFTVLFARSSVRTHVLLFVRSVIYSITLTI